MKKSGLYIFGEYSLDASRRVLTRGTEPVPVPPKTLDLLIAFVESGGRLLTKAELLDTLWADANVEEASLAFQVSNLRKLFGGEGSGWIETVAKHGYRFTAPVDRIGDAQMPARFDSVPTPPVLPARKPMVWWCIITAIVVASLYAVYVAGGRRNDPAARSSRAPQVAEPLSSYPGFQQQPSLSPDGSQVAFSWNGHNEDNFDIYVKLVGPGEPLRLTSHPARDESPAWSPDGHSIAFLRFSTKRNAGLFLVPALGGGEKKLADIITPHIWYLGLANLAWSPDGKFLAFGGKFVEDELPGIWLISVETGERRRLTGLRSLIGDLSPAFAPDGRRVAFVRRASLWVDDVYIQRLTQDKYADGEPARVTFEAIRTLGVAWSADGRSLVYSSRAGALSHLRTIDVQPGAAVQDAEQRLPFGENAVTVSISRTGRLVYARYSQDSNLWSVDLTQKRVVSPVRLMSSTFDDHVPAYSPDGRRIAFASTRSGFEEIWIARADGSDSKQLTFLRARKTANPRWSLDGKAILFNSRTTQSDVYTIYLDGGVMRRITDDPAEEIEPNWSRDGQWIYYASSKTGRYEVNRIPAAGGLPVQLTRNGGVYSCESWDRKWVYFARDGESPTAIWKIPYSGGPETKLIDGLSYSTNFVPTERGIYFMSVGERPNTTAIDFYDFRTSKRFPLAALRKEWFYGLTISPDHRSLIYSVIDHAGSNLMVVDNSH